MYFRYIFIYVEVASMIFVVLLVCKFFKICSSFSIFFNNLTALKEARRVMNGLNYIIIIYTKGLVINWSLEGLIKQAVLLYLLHANLMYYITFSNKYNFNIKTWRPK